MFDERGFRFGERLREPEAQPLVAVFVRFDEVEAAGIRLRDAARLRQDQIEQRLDVTFGSERDADARQLADFPGALRRLAARPRRFGARGGFAEPRPDGDEQAPRAGRLGQEAGQEFRRHAVRHVVLAVASQGDDRAARVHERAHDVDGEDRAALGVEQENGRPVVGDRQLLRLAHGPRLDLRRLQRISRLGPDRAARGGAIGRGSGRIASRQGFHARERAERSPRHLVHEIVELPRRFRQVRDGEPEIAAVFRGERVRFMRKGVEAQQQAVGVCDRGRNRIRQAAL